MSDKKNKKLHLVSLGCAKNLVDSEIMLGRLGKTGCEFTQDPSAAEIIIVNTCSFIKSAADESIDTILELAKFRTAGKCRRLIVTGCLPERYGDDISSALPEVDFFLGTGAYHMIAQAADGALEDKTRCLMPDPDSIGQAELNGPRVRSSPHIAYLKVAEGCSRHCTYCIIPRLRGKQKSRACEDIIEEARKMILSGAKELILVAQDTTAYGTDLKESGPGFQQLLREMAEIDSRVWIRFLYGHPESMHEDIVKTAAELDNVCSYFDIPVQHASQNVLKRMGRQYTKDDLLRLFDTIRSRDAGASLRTTVITGFPGETENDFETLLGFVSEVGFDHMGVFTYSDSEDLPSHKLTGHVPEDVARDRLDTLMSAQADISSAKNRQRIGKTYRVLVENELGDGLYSGRTVFQAPEADGITSIRSGILKTGSFAMIKITDASEYDIKGEAV